MSSGEESRVIKELQDFRKDFSVFVTKLMGDETQENPEGRIPRLEAGQKNLNRRVRRIESVGLMAAGALAVFKFASALLDAAHNFFSIFQHAQR